MSSHLINIPNDLCIMITCYLNINDIFKLFETCKYFRHMYKSEILIKHIIKNIYFIKPKPINKRNGCANGHLFCSFPDSKFIKLYWNYYLFRTHNVVDSVVKFENMYKSLKLYSKTKRKWTLYNDNFVNFKNTATMKVLYRLLSFQFWMTYKLFNIHDENICNRTLNSLENNIFQHIYVNIKNEKFIVHATNKKNGKKLDITKYKSFLMIFHFRYAFFDWRKFINWNHYFIAGSSVLSALIDIDWRDSDVHDVDIFSYGISLKQFNKEVLKFLSYFSDIYYKFINRVNTKTIIVKIGHKCVILQFIWLCKLGSPQQIIHNFDLDICQCIFFPNEQKVMVSGAFIQAIQTGSIICYTMINNKQIMNIDTSIRLQKYIKKGFQYILIPKTMKLKFLQQCLNSKNEKVVVKKNSIHRKEYVLFNVAFDFFEIQKNFINLL